MSSSLVRIPRLPGPISEIFKPFLCFKKPSQASRASWNPALLHAEIKLKQKEIQSIQVKMPRAGDNRYYADAVFEGGGVKGIAFLGALRCLDDAGIRLRKVAGTSAGAITAALVAAQVPIQELEQIMGELDYEKEFLREQSSLLIDTRSPQNDLEIPHIFWTWLNLAIAWKKGKYSSEPFYDWLSKILARYGLETFESVGEEKSREQDADSSIPWYAKRQLKIIISDISKGEMRELPKDLREYNRGLPDCQKLQEKSFRIAEAVRLSMSIPFFFEPGKLGQSEIVDGGALSNFPIWAYDTSGAQAPHCPTFGFMLTEREKQAAVSKTVLGVFSNLFKTLLVARDRHDARTRDEGRVIRIQTDPEVTSTKFALSNEQKDKLYREGYESTMKFLLNEWDWEQHLEERGHSRKSDSARSLALTSAQQK